MKCSLSRSNEIANFIAREYSLGPAFAQAAPFDLFVSDALAVHVELAHGIFALALERVAVHGAAELVGHLAHGGLDKSRSRPQARNSLLRR